MAESTILRASAINRTPNAGAKPQAQLSGALPVVNINMNSGGPQIQGGQGTVRQGVTLLPPKGAQRRFTTGGLPGPVKEAVVVSPLPAKAQVQSTALTADQLLLCRHLVDKYLGDLRTATGEAQPDEATGNNIKLAETAIVAIDAGMAAITAAAAVAAVAVTSPPAPRAVAVGSRNAQGASATTPRRVARPAPPPVIVNMDAGQPVVKDPPPLVTESPAQA